MKTMESTMRRGVTTPCEFTEKEFLSEIRTAENGPFHSMEEGIRRFDEWKENRKK